MQKTSLTTAATGAGAAQTTSTALTIIPPTKIEAQPPTSLAEKWDPWFHAALSRRLSTWVPPLANAWTWCGWQ